MLQQKILSVEALLNDLQFVVHSGPEGIEADWLEIERLGFCSPYQRYDWLRAWYLHACPADFLPAIVGIRDGAARLLAIFPLVLGKNFLVRECRFAGGAHSNINLPILHPEFAAILSADLGRTILARLSKALGNVDLFTFERLPREWGGRPNSFAALGETIRSHSMPVLSLPGLEDAPPLQFSKSTRRKFTQKRKWLEELGLVEFRTILDASEADSVIDAFLDQKRSRLDQQGIDDPFSAPGGEAFLRSIAHVPKREGAPAMELSVAVCGDAYVAILGASVSGARMSGSIISFDATPAFSRCSPGELLVQWAVHEAWRRGLEIFDLGAGEARYKSRFCTEREELVDVQFPVTALGRVTVMVTGRLRQVKRTLERRAATTQPMPDVEE